MTDTGSSISSAMQQAHALRQEWVRTLSAKETTFSHVVELSKTQEYKALASLRVLQVLTRCEGWTERSASEALAHFGIGPKDTLKAIRVNKGKIEVVDRLLRSSAQLWRPRPKFPEGWPFSGKLSALYGEMQDTEIPDELLALMDEDERPGEEASGTAEDDTMDELSLLMRGD